MHLEVLVEDRSGKTFLDIALKRIFAQFGTFRVLPFRGIGKIPKGFNAKTDVGKRILLDQLPRLLRGYGIAWAAYPADYQTALIIICDLDDKDRTSFHSELLTVLDKCSPKPRAVFCIAVEEGEAWLLGELAAIKQAYPKARDKILQEYVNDSICGTWERLADAVFPGGARALSQKGWQGVGAEKSRWAENITPHMDFTSNKSPSFCCFYKQVRKLLGQGE